MTDRQLVFGLSAGACIGLAAATAALMLLLGCTPAPVLPQGCGDDTLAPIPRNATPAEAQAIRWSNNTHACRCLMPTCPDYGLPS